MTPTPHSAPRPPSRDGRRWVTATLVALVVVGVLSSSLLTATASESRRAGESSATSEETDGERSLEMARRSARDQVEVPPAPATPLPPGEIASATEVARDVSPPLATIPPRPAQARGRDNESEYRPPKVQGTGDDPVAQKSPGGATIRAITQVGSFAGPGQENMAVGVAPPDPNTAVGPNHIITITNLSYAIYSKAGATLYGPVTNSTLFSGFSGACGKTNDGDGVVAYDRAADRWVMSWFAGTNGTYGAYYECVAVSQTPDPLGSWYRYAFQYASFNDYPKLAVWSDGYYITYNMFGSIFFEGAMVCALDRAKMLVGASAQQVCRQPGSQYYSMLASDLDGPTPPPAGAPNIVMVPSSDTPDYLYAFKFRPDWAVTANSVFTALGKVPVAPFNWANNADSVPQPGTTQKLDDMGGMLMNRLAYRNFGDHESIVATHAAVVGTITGVRWYEFRLDGSGNPVVYQQGTYAPDTVHRWMSSAAMDGVGNIAVGYSASNTSVYPGLRAAGRLAGDPLGTLTQPEVTLQAGIGSQTQLGRWGDYGSMAVDPVDDCTFWFTGEYLRQTGAFNWSTRVASLRLPNCGTSIGVSVAPTSASVAPSASTTTTVSTSTKVTPAPTLTFSTTGLPTGVTATFSPTSVTAGDPTTLTVAVGANVAAGAYPVTVRATDGTNLATTTFTLTVLGPPVAPAAPSVRRDGWGSAWVSSTPPSWDGGAAVTGYTFTSSPGGQTCTADAATAACSITGLAPSTAYTFTVRATNTFGSSASSSPSASVTAVGRTGFQSTASISAAKDLDLVANSSAPVPVGARVLVYVTADNAGSTSPTIKTVSFPNGGRASCSAYSALSGATSTAGTGIRAGIVSCAITTAIPTSGVMRVTLSTSVARAVAMGEYFVGFASGGSITSTTPTSSSASAPASGTTASVSAGRLVIGAWGYEDGALVLADDTDTAGGGWGSAMLRGNGTSGAGGVSVTRQLKWTTSASTQRYNTATSTTTGENWAAFILTLS